MPLGQTSHCATESQGKRCCARWSVGVPAVRKSDEATRLSPAHLSAPGRGWAVAATPPSARVKGKGTEHASEA